MPQCTPTQHNNKKNTLLPVISLAKTRRCKMHRKCTAHEITPKIFCILEFKVEFKVKL
jgi:hypothetical protein